MRFGTTAKLSNDTGKGYSKILRRRTVERSVDARNPREFSIFPEIVLKIYKKKCIAIVPMGFGRRLREFSHLTSKIELNARF